jgi:hypothetical protein
MKEKQICKICSIENTILVTKFVNTSKNTLVYGEYIKLLKEVCDNI